MASSSRTLGDLPPELLQQILSYCDDHDDFGSSADIRDFSELRLICRQMRDAVSLYGRVDVETRKGAQQRVLKRIGGRSQSRSAQVRHLRVKGILKSNDHYRLRFGACTHLASLLLSDSAIESGLDELRRVLGVEFPHLKSCSIICTNGDACRWFRTVRVEALLSIWYAPCLQKLTMRRISITSDKNWGSQLPVKELQHQGTPRSLPPVPHLDLRGCCGSTAAAFGLFLGRSVECLSYLHTVRVHGPLEWDTIQHFMGVSLDYVNRELRMDESRAMTPMSFFNRATSVEILHVDAASLPTHLGDGAYLNLSAQIRPPPICRLPPRLRELYVTVDKWPYSRETLHGKLVEWLENKPGLPPDLRRIVLHAPYHSNLHVQESGIEGKSWPEERLFQVFGSGPGTHGDDLLQKLQKVTAAMGIELSGFDPPAHIPGMAEEDDAEEEVSPQDIDTTVKIQNRRKRRANGK